jgi:aspartate kinase
MSFGERISTRVVAAAMRARGIRAEAVSACDIGLVTTPDHGCAVPLPEAYDRLRAALAQGDRLPVVTGFLGISARGAVTTLGRSGSDYSATIIAAAVGAEEVQIWTDVDGVMTCDPSLDRRAESLPILSFEEASELAYYGAKVLHKNTLVPAMSREIPVRVLNTGNPSDPGTTIIGAPTRSSRIAKSVVYKEDVCLVSLGSLRLTSAAQLLSASLDAMRRNGVGIHMATTSEATVSLVTESGCDEDCLRAALAELTGLAYVKAERGKAVICVVGEELRGRAEVLGRIFGAVSACGIKARMVSQSASEINVAFLVDNEEIAPAVRSLHGVLLGR